MRSGWKRYPSGHGPVYVLIGLVAGVRWTAKLIPTHPGISDRACHKGWILRIWRETTMVDEQGADLPGTNLARGKRAAIARLRQLARLPRGDA